MIKKTFFYSLWNQWKTTTIFVSFSRFVWSDSNLKTNFLWMFFSLIFGSINIYKKGALRGERERRIATIKLNFFLFSFSSFRHLSIAMIVEHSELEVEIKSSIHTDKVWNMMLRWCLSTFFCSTIFLMRSRWVESCKSVIEFEEIIEEEKWCGNCKYD